MNSQDIYLHALNLFVDHGNNERPSMSKPFIQQDYIIATDANTMIAFNNDKAKVETDENSDDLPNAIKYLELESNIDKVFEIAHIRAAIKKIEEEFNRRYEIKNVVCPDCAGTIGVDYVFISHTNEVHSIEGICPSCDEKGYISEITDKETGDRFSFVRKLIEYDDSCMNAKYLNRLIKVAELFEVKQIKLVYKGNAIFKFIVGEAIIVIASIVTDFESVKVTIHHQSS